MNLKLGTEIKKKFELVDIKFNSIESKFETLIAKNKEKSNENFKYHS